MSIFGLTILSTGQILTHFAFVVLQQKNLPQLANSVYLFIRHVDALNSTVNIVPHHRFILFMYNYGWTIGTIPAGKAV